MKKSFKLLLFALMAISAAALYLAIFNPSFNKNSAKHHKVNVMEENAKIIQGLEPVELFKSFLDISTIRRDSGYEAGIARYVITNAQKNHLKWITNAYHDVIVEVPASGREYANRSSITFQFHGDMVHEPKNKNIWPIAFRVKDDLLSATNTTLGADDGIGLAAGIALMNPGLRDLSGKEVKHGPFKLIMTTGEETTMNGVVNLDFSTLQTNKIIENLDSEDEGTITVGSAGALKAAINLKVHFVDSKQPGTMYRIKISNLLGGHSGVEIDKHRLNAIEALIPLLSDKDLDLSLVSIKAGSAINTIPRDLEMEVFVSGKNNQKLSNAVLVLEKKILSDYPNEKPLLVSQTVSNSGLKIMAGDDQKKLLDILNKIPNGVQKKETFDPTMVQSSNNLASIDMSKDVVVIKTMARSSMLVWLNSFEKSITRLVESNGATIKVLAKYEPWQPQFNTPLSREASAKYFSLFHKKLKIKTTHGGLECSIFYKKIPNAQIISFGPSVFNPHTPNESVSISSIKRFWEFLLSMVKTKLKT